MSDPLVFNPNDHDGNADPRLIEELMRDRQTMNDPRVMAALLLEERAQRKARASEGPQYPHKPEVGVGEYGLGYLPPLPPRPSDELRSALAPEVDTFMGGTGLPTSAGPALNLAYSIGSAGPRQVQKAESAIAKALAEPSVGSVANAGTQTGMAALRPAIALPSLALQYGDAIARDLGLYDTSAQAQAPLLRKQQRELEMERQRSEMERQRQREQAAQEAELARERAAQEAQITRERAAQDAETRRLEAETATRLKLEEQEAARQSALKIAAESKDREEYDRAVKRAEELRTVEEGKRRRFYDTAVGKVYDETGGAAPLVLGALSGFTQRALNPAVTHGKILGMGAFGGAAASNLPSFADAFIVPPVENPDQRAASVYARELPPAHPRKAEWLAYAENEKLLPKMNPQRAVAKEEFTDTTNAIKRNIGGAIEGMVGAELGMGLWGIPARFINALGSGLRGLAGRPAPAGTPGGGGGGTPPGGAFSTQPTAGGQSSAHTQLEKALMEPPRLADRVREAQSRMPAALPSPPSPLPSWASEPPVGLKLPKDTYWDANRKQLRHRDGTYVETPKYKSPRD